MPRPPTRTRLLVEALLPLALAALALLRGHQLATALLAVIGGTLALSALLAPWLGAALHHLARRATRRLALGLTWVLLAAVHVLVITPAGLLVRLLGRDPLERRFPSGQPSHWTPHAPSDPARIRRTF